MLFGHWLQQREIPDPYKKSEEAFSHVSVDCTSWKSMG
jgi:protein-tyrosine phosphatase